MAPERPGTLQSLSAALASRRIGAVTLQSFSSGLPLGLVWIALPAYLTYRGVDIRTVGLFSLAQAPWTFKFLWAPLLDRFEPRFLGRKRSWIVVWQAALLVGIGLLAAARGLARRSGRRRPRDPRGFRVGLAGRRDRRLRRGRARKVRAGAGRRRPRGAVPGAMLLSGAVAITLGAAVRLAGGVRGAGAALHSAGGRGRVVASAAAGSRRGRPADAARGRRRAARRHLPPIARAADHRVSPPLQVRREPGHGADAPLSHPEVLRAGGRGPRDGDDRARGRRSSGRSSAARPRSGSA